jgi:5'-methylthioadenosine phosphorylase
MKEQAEIGIIGGTGVYDPKLLENAKRIKISTPYGMPSDLITIGELAGRKIAFINRHGEGHTIPPHMVNSHANIWALKELGVRRILAPCAVGSLKENYKPGHIVILDQFVDFTKSRKYTYYDGKKVYHISAADPFCKELREVLITAGAKLRLSLHKTGTYVCVEGPRFSTRAESKMFRTWADVIGMTLIPECVLARELEICYASVAMVSDFDVWADRPVTTEEVLNTMRENLEKVKSLLQEAVPGIPYERECECKDALKNAGI